MEILSKITVPMVINFVFIFIFGYLVMSYYQVKEAIEGQFPGPKLPHNFITQLVVWGALAYFSISLIDNLFHIMPELWLRILVSASLATLLLMVRQHKKG